MAVYVDNARNPFGRYRMCHLWADTREELFAMVDRIGVQRKWFQCPPKAPWEHFDITQSKRALAVAAGVIETDKYGPAEHVARLQFNCADPVLVERGRKKLLQIAECRTKGFGRGEA